MIKSGIEAFCILMQCIGRLLARRRKLLPLELAPSADCADFCSANSVRYFFAARARGRRKIPERSTER